MQRRIGFVLKPCLVGYFLCFNGIFFFLVPARSYFLPLVTTPSRFPLHTRAADEVGATTPPLLCILEVFGRTRYALCKGLSFLQGLFFPDQAATHQMVIGRQFYIPFNTHVQR